MKKYLIAVLLVTSVVYSARMVAQTLLREHQLNAQAPASARNVGVMRQAQTVFTAANFGTPSEVRLPFPTTSGNGDFNFGYGLAIDRLASGQWRLFTTSWKPQYVLEYNFPASFSGTGAFVRNLGDMKAPGQLFGLYFDKASNRVCATSSSTYDADPSTTLTLSCSEIDPVTKKFKTVTSSTGERVVVARRWMFTDANQPCRSFPAPVVTDVAANFVTFAVPHQLQRSAMVMVSDTGGGLLQTSYYYVNPRTPNSLSFHRLYYEAYNNQNAIDLTAQITSAMTSCTPRGDRRTMGGIVDVPPEFVPVLHGTHLAGFGGYQSVVTSGDSSMGPTACAFTLPEQTYLGGVACTPVLGYPYSAQGGPNFANRDGNYVNTIDWDANPEKGADNVKLYGHGKWAPGDTISQSAFFIAKPFGAVLGFLADVQQGTIWYGENYHGLWPTQYESLPVAPIATDLSTSTVTLPSSVAWDTGAMVSLTSAQGGLRGDPTVYFLRKVAPGKYKFFRSLQEAQTGVLGLVPSETDLTNNRVTFSAPHGIQTQTVVRVETAGGGLKVQNYYVNAAYPLALSFHQERADAAGTVYGQEKNKVDLTAPITSRLVATPLKLLVPLTARLRLKSYAAQVSGSKAALNSQGENHVFYAYDPNALGGVAAGTSSEWVQPVSYDRLDFPGFTYPVPGLPGYPRQVLGVYWMESADRLAVQIADHTAEKKGRRVAFYPFVPPAQ